MDEVFERAGHIDLAIEMFLDLKRYTMQRICCEVSVIILFYSCANGPGPIFLRLTKLPALIVSPLNFSSN